VKFSRIEVWEAATAFPTYPQFELLAHELKVPLAVFFFPDRREHRRLECRSAHLLMPNSITSRVGLGSCCERPRRFNLPELTQGRNPTPADNARPHFPG
jgi:hypothetical protein